MADDCRIINDGVNDLTAQAGALIKGSDAVDISGATMTTGVNGWYTIIKTVSPALQHPRLATTVALYLDVDGRASNNAVAGPRLGADTVYAMVNENGSWRMTKEALNTNSNVFEVAPTQATYQIVPEGYVINIPYSEVPKNAPAFWKVGVAVKDTGRLTVDYVPDVGMNCAPVLTAEPAVISMDRLVQIAAGAIVIILVAVLIWKKLHKKKKYDQQTQPH
jgi:hypothetical protein